MLEKAAWVIGETQQPNQPTIARQTRARCFHLKLQPESHLVVTGAREVSWWAGLNKALGGLYSNTLHQQVTVIGRRAIGGGPHRNGGAQT